MWPAANNQNTINTQVNPALNNVLNQNITLEAPKPAPAPEPGLLQNVIGWELTIVLLFVIFILLGCTILIWRKVCKRCRFFKGNRGCLSLCCFCCSRRGGDSRRRGGGGGGGDDHDSPTIRLPARLSLPSRPVSPVSPLSSAASSQHEGEDPVNSPASSSSSRSVRLFASGFVQPAAEDVPCGAEQKAPLQLDDQDCEGSLAEDTPTSETGAEDGSMPVTASAAVVVAPSAFPAYRCCVSVRSVIRNAAFRGFLAWALSVLTVCLVVYVVTEFLFEPVTTTRWAIAKAAFSTGYEGYSWYYYYTSYWPILQPYVVALVTIHLPALIPTLRSFYCPCMRT